MDQTIDCFPRHHYFFNSLEAFHIPPGYERRILRLNSLGELVVDTSGISIGSHTGPGAENPLWTTNIFRSPPRTVQELYSLGEGVDILVVSQLPETSITYMIRLHHFSGTTSNIIVIPDT
jgi:hypothetical protein